MPAFQLDPNAAGSYAQWSVYPSGTALANVSDDDDNTQIRSDGGADLYHSFGLADLPADAETVSGAVVHHGRYSTGPAYGGTLYAFMRYSGTNGFVSIVSGVPKSWTVTEVTASFADCPGSSGWTVAQVNAAEQGVRAATSGTLMVCAKLWVTGTYLPAGACFIPILSLALAVIGPGLQLAHMPALARFIFERRRMPGGARVLIRSDEYEAALGSWRAYRHPRLMFVGQAAYGF
jgi:hypothetical protein